MRCYYTMLPFAPYLPRMMVIHMLTTVVFYINAFMWDKGVGVSEHLPPVTLIEGIVLDYRKHFHVIPGKYIHTFEDLDNTGASCTVGGVELGPIINLQGGVCVFSLVSGKILF